MSRNQDTGGSPRRGGAGFDEIYAAQATAILRYLKRVTGSRDAAEELLQETFLKLHVQLSSGEPLADVRAWLFRVAANLANDRARASIRSGRREARLSSQTPRIVEFDPRVERREAILAALRLVPPRMRQVMLLAAEGCTYREIAEVTGIEAGYVGVLLQRARAAFAKYYDTEAIRHHGRGSDRRTVR